MLFLILMEFWSCKIKKNIYIHKYLHTHTHTHIYIHIYIQITLNKIIYNFGFHLIICEFSNLQVCFILFRPKSEFLMDAICI
jgi:hypothetical protein